MQAYPEIDVQRAERLHVSVRELKLVDLQVGHQAIVIVALRNDSQALLHRPAEEHLRGGCSNFIHW